MFDGESCIRCGKYCKFEELKVLPSSYGVCAECAVKIDPNNKPKRMCPQDSTEMRKELVQDQVVIDRCNSCGGMWIDKDELEVIRQLAQREGVASNTAMMVLVLSILS